MVVNGGLDFLTSTAASNGASCFAILEPWDERTSREKSLPVILATARRELSSLSDAVVVAFNPPPIRGLGSTGGFQMQVLDEDAGSLSECSRLFPAADRELM